METRRKGEKRSKQDWEEGKSNANCRYGKDTQWHQLHSIYNDQKNAKDQFMQLKVSMHTFLSQLFAEPSVCLLQSSFGMALF